MMEATSGACAARDEAEGPLAAIDRRLQILGGNLEEMARRLNAHADRVHGSPPPSPVEPNSKSRLGDELQDRPDGALRRVFQSCDNLETVFERLAVATDRNMALA